MPSSPNSILKAIRQLINKNTLENANQLASLVGLTLLDPNKKIEVVEHTTKKGKVIKGIVRTDLSYAEAKAIDEFTFKKDGGWFIRDKYLGLESQPVASQKPPTETAQNEPVAVVESDTLVSDDSIKNIERVVGRNFYKWREIDLLQYDLKPEYLEVKELAANKSHDDNLTVNVQEMFDAIKIKTLNKGQADIVLDVAKKLNAFIKSNSSDTALFYAVDWLIDKRTRILLEEKISEFLDALLPQEIASTSEEFSLIVKNIMNVLANWYPLNEELKRIKEYKRPDNASLLTGSTKTYKKNIAKFSKIFEERRRYDSANNDTDPKEIIAAIHKLMANNTPENARALAEAAGLEIAQPQANASDLNAQEQAVMDVMLKSGIYNFATMRDNEDFSKLAALSENEFEIVKLILEDTKKELTKKVVKHILENSTDYPNAIGKNMVANSDLDGMNIAPLAKLAKIKKTAKTPDDLFKLMASSTANQDVRYYLTGIKVEDNGDLISTDGHSMTIIRDSGINREAGIYTTAQRLEGLKRALLKQGKSQEEIDKEIKAQEDSFKEHKFPDYKRVYPNKHRFVEKNILKIDVAKLKGIVDSIVKAFKRAISNKFLGVSLEFNQNEIVFNVQYLQNGLDLMASMGYKQVNLYLQEDARSPMLIEPEDEKVSFIVMPMVDNRNYKAIKTINLNNLDDWNWSKSNFDDIDTEDDEDFEDEDINQLSFF